MRQSIRRSSHTLLITCADSRIDPEALTQSVPGEIFVARNIGNHGAGVWRDDGWRECRH